MDAVYFCSNTPGVLLSGRKSWITRNPHHQGKSWMEQGCSLCELCWKLNLITQTCTVKELFGPCALPIYQNWWILMTGLLNSLQRHTSFTVTFFLITFCHAFKVISMILSFHYHEIFQLLLCSSFHNDLHEHLKGKLKNLERI